MVNKKFEIDFNSNTESDDTATRKNMPIIKKIFYSILFVSISAGALLIFDLWNSLKKAQVNEGNTCIVNLISASNNRSINDDIIVSAFVNTTIRPYFGNRIKLSRSYCYGHISSSNLDKMPIFDASLDVDERLDNQGNIFGFDVSIIMRNFQAIGLRSLVTQANENARLTTTCKLDLSILAYGYMKIGFNYPFSTSFPIDTKFIKQTLFENSNYTHDNNLNPEASVISSTKASYKFYSILFTLPIPSLLKQQLKNIGMSSLIFVFPSLHYNVQLDSMDSENLNFNLNISTFDLMRDTTIDGEFSMKSCDGSETLRLTNLLLKLITDKNIAIYADTKNDDIISKFLGTEHYIIQTGHHIALQTKEKELSLRLVNILSRSSLADSNCNSFNIDDIFTAYFCEEHLIVLDSNRENVVDIFYLMYQSQFSVVANISTSFAKLNLNADIDYNDIPSLAGSFNLSASLFSWKLLNTNAFFKLIEVPTSKDIYDASIVFTDILYSWNGALNGTLFAPDASNWNYKMIGVTDSWWDYENIGNIVTSSGKSECGRNDKGFAEFHFFASSKGLGDINLLAKTAYDFKAINTFINGRIELSLNGRDQIIGSFETVADTTRKLRSIILDASIPSNNDDLQNSTISKATIKNIFTAYEFKSGSAPDFDSAGNIYFTNGSCLISLEKTRGSKLWEQCSFDGGNLSPPKIDKETIYVISDKGTLYARMLKSGEPVWNYQPSYSDEVKKNSLRPVDIINDFPVIYSGLVYFVGIDSLLYALSLNTKNATLKGPPYQTSDGSLISYPIIYEDFYSDTSSLLLSTSLCGLVILVEGIRVSPTTEKFEPNQNECLVNKKPLVSLYHDEEYLFSLETNLGKLLSYKVYWYCYYWAGNSCFVYQISSFHLSNEFSFYNSDKSSAFIYALSPTKMFVINPSERSIVELVSKPIQSIYPLPENNAYALFTDGTLAYVSSQAVTQTVKSSCAPFAITSPMQYLFYDPQLNKSFYQYANSTFKKCNFQMCHQEEEISFSTAGCSGDTVLRFSKDYYSSFYDDSPNDLCSSGKIYPFFNEWSYNQPCSNYVIDQGCYDGTICSGQTTIENSFVIRELKVIASLQNLIFKEPNTTFFSYGNSVYVASPSSGTLTRVDIIADSLSYNSVFALHLNLTLNTNYKNDGEFDLVLNKLKVSLPFGYLNIEDGLVLQSIRALDPLSYDLRANWSLSIINTDPLEKPRHVATVLSSVESFGISTNNFGYRDLKFDVTTLSPNFFVNVKSSFSESRFDGVVIADFLNPNHFNIYWNYSRGNVPEIQLIFHAYSVLLTLEAYHIHDGNYSLNASIISQNDFFIFNKKPYYASLNPESSWPSARYSSMNSGLSPFYGELDQGSTVNRLLTLNSLITSQPIIDKYGNLYILTEDKCLTSVNVRSTKSNRVNWKTCVQSVSSLTGPSLVEGDMIAFFSSDGTLHYVDKNGAVVNELPLLKLARLPSNALLSSEMAPLFSIPTDDQRGYFSNVVFLPLSDGSFCLFDFTLLKCATPSDGVDGVSFKVSGAKIVSAAMSKDKLTVGYSNGVLLNFEEDLQISRKIPIFASDVASSQISDWEFRVDVLGRMADSKTVLVSDGYSGMRYGVVRKSNISFNANDKITELGADGSVFTHLSTLQNFNGLLYESSEIASLSLSAADAEGSVYFGDKNGEFIIYDLKSSLSKFNISDSPIIIQPSIDVDGAVYIVAGREIISIGGRAKTICPSGQGLLTLVSNSYSCRPCIHGVSENNFCTFGIDKSDNGIFLTTRGRYMFDTEAQVALASIDKLQISIGSKNKDLIVIKNAVIESNSTLTRGGVGDIFISDTKLSAFSFDVTKDAAIFSIKLSIDPTHTNAMAAFRLNFKDDSISFCVVGFQNGNQLFNSSGVIEYSRNFLDNFPPHAMLGQLVVNDDDFMNVSYRKVSANVLGDYNTVNALVNSNIDTSWFRIYYVPRVPKVPTLMPISPPQAGMIVIAKFNVSQAFEGLDPTSYYENEAANKLTFQKTIASIAKLPSPSNVDLYSVTAHSNKFESKYLQTSVAIVKYGITYDISLYSGNIDTGYKAIAETLKKSVNDGTFSSTLQELAEPNSPLKNVQASTTIPITISELVVIQVSSPTATPTLSPTLNKDDKPMFNIAMIAGIAAGGGFVLLLLSAFVVYKWKAIEIYLKNRTKHKIVAINYELNDNENGDIEVPKLTGN